MTSEESSKIERLAEQTTPRPLGFGENLVLSLKLLLGAGILVFLFWYFDSQVVK
jgi:hypothetical protein